MHRFFVLKGLNMALEIAIEELGNGSEKVAYLMLPTNKSAFIDAMDRGKIFGETSLRIYECDEVPELVEHEFTEEPTLDELNFLARRIEDISEENTEILAYRALLQKPFDTIREAINRTYNLQTVPVLPFKTVYLYGETVLENEMLEELDDIPDEVYELLDPDKVGRAMMKREGGVFIGGYYAIPDSYDPALVYDEELPERMENWVFRLEITGNPTENEDVSKKDFEVLTLPADEEYMRQLAEKVGEKFIDECVFVDFKSAVPQITDECFESMENIHVLNDIAQKYSELSREDAAKFKAVISAEELSALDDIEDTLTMLDQYEADISINYDSEFGEKYLLKMLPPDFDRALLKGVCTAAFARRIFAANDCAFTEYGVVSKCGGHLYSMVEAPQQEQENTFEMGGIS